MRPLGGGASQTGRLARAKALRCIPGLTRRPVLLEPHVHAPKLNLQMPRCCWLFSTQLYQGCPALFFQF